MMSLFENIVAEVESSNVNASICRSGQSIQYHNTTKPACVKPIKLDPQLFYMAMIQLIVLGEKFYMLPV